MGLIKLNAGLLKTCLHAWAVPLVITATSLLLAVYGDAGRALLQYDRLLIGSGEVQRLIGGHLVHLGLSHMALNLAGLWLVWFLVGRTFSALQWLLIIAVSIAVIDIGFWFLLPELAWYVGLSGVLHGLLAAGAIGLWQERRVEAAVLALVLAAKLSYEAFVGPVPGSEATAGGAVVTEAHLYGAIGGLLAVLKIRVLQMTSL